MYVCVCMCVVCVCVCVCVCVQSMNMIAALGLLFLDEETAFWLV